MSCSLTSENKRGRHHIWIHGDIDEDFDANKLQKLFSEHVTLHLEGVESISSCGIREWITLVSGLPSALDLEFEKCSIPITRQFGMLSNFRGPGIIKSFYAPYYCEHCDEESERLLHVDDCHRTEQALTQLIHTCSVCGGALEFDGVERVYFSFLREMAHST